MDVLEILCSFHDKHEERQGNYNFIVIGTFVFQRKVMRLVDGKHHSVLLSLLRYTFHSPKLM